MDFAWDDHEREFRQSVVDFLDANWDSGAVADMDGDWDRERQFTKVLAEHGWLTMAWPKEYGGNGASAIEQMIFKEEAAKRAAPTGGGGVSLVGPTLMIHGTEEQRKEHMPGIANAEVVWCQGYSEPGAGSDLASLQTRAVRDGDEYVINGQKIWTSGAHHADWIHVLTRTDTDAPKHRGISYFMLNIRTPGITVRPLEQMHGAHGFNETFFEDVRVPARNIIGEENRGWYVATTTLDFERSGVQRAAAAIRAFTRLRDHVSDPANHVELSDVQRHSMAATAVETFVAQVLGYRVAWMQSQGLVPNYEASMSKVSGAELNQRNARRGINILGQHGALKPESDHAVIGGMFCQLYMSTVPATIAGGSVEINRNIVATRGLGLPRG